MGGDAPAATLPPGAGSPAHSLRVLCVLYAPEPVPGPRYRVLQYLPELARHGLRCDTLAVLSTVTAQRSVASGGASPLARLWHWGRMIVETQLGCLRILRRLGRYDRVLIYRVVIPGWAVRRLRARRDDLVYDYDDALDAGEGTTWLERLRQRLLARGLERAVRACATISTSNRRNAGVIERLGGHAVVVPTSVDVSIFPERPATVTGAPVVLGWMGTPSTARYLPAIESALSEVLAQRPGTVVRLVGSGGNPFTTLTPDVREWRADREVADLLGFDVGLMPMPDTKWTRGKAALKALQYGAARTPTVASWTSTNEEILGPESGAVLCRTTEDWVAALLRLIDDPAGRRIAGDAARAHVRRHFSVEANGPRLAAVLRRPTEAPA